MTPRFTSVLLMVVIAAIFSSGSRAQDPASPAELQQKPKPASPTEMQDDVLRVETDLVTTLFTAVDREHSFVTSLRAEDVRILENGIEQEIGLFERETDRPLSLVVLIDTSRSQERTLPDEKRAAKAFVRSVVRPEKDRVAVVSFTGRPKVEASLINDVSMINAAIDRMSVEFPPEGCDSAIPVTEDPRCWTSIWDSVIASTSGLLRSTKSNTRRAIILLTDGDDTASQAQRDEAIQFAIKNDVVVYGIGIGDPELYRLEKGPLTKLATKTGGRAFFPKEELELTKAFSQIQEELRSQYLVGYSPRNKTRDGSYRKIKIEVVNPEWRKRKLYLLHREGYYARQD